MREPIENFMLGTAFVAPITGTALILRIVVRKRGRRAPHPLPGRHRGAERILSTDFPRSYSYMPYAYDIPIRLFSDYAKATMSALPVADEEARIVWDYTPSTRRTVHHCRWCGLFVALDWKRNLQNGLD